LTKPRERLTLVFNFRIAQQFKKRAIAPSPRGAVATSAAMGPAFDNNRFGAYAAIGAIALGGVMLMANIAHNRSATLSAASVANVSDTSYGTIAVKSLAAPQPDATPIAVAPATPVPSPVAAAEKSPVRVDTSPTGAIASAPVAHPKHKAHPKKTKDVDSKT
jgi:hypothetical protein